MAEYTLIDALKSGDFWYPHFLLKEWYTDHISWRIHHHLLRERCETCRNWKFCGKWEGRSYGTCEVDTEYWQDFHGHCWCWNMTFDEEFCEEDEWERPWTTPLGKKIFQISRGGIWQYKCDREGKKI